MLILLGHAQKLIFWEPYIDISGRGIFIFLKELTTIDLF